jgi:hypothetical protein
MTSITAKGLFDVPNKLYLGLRWEINHWEQIDGKNVRRDKSVVTAPKLDNEKYPLGFVTYADKQDASFQKRKKTVDDWAGISGARNVEPTADGIYLDNDALEGFQIFDFESRWYTSNKWFCVKDPRGFHLQISAAALIDLLNHTDVKKGGHIQGKCVWGRRDGTNIVVPVDSELYKATVKLNNASKAYNIGDQVIIGKEEMVFLGELFRLDISITDAKKHLPYQVRDAHLYDRYSYNSVIPYERTIQFSYNNSSDTLEKRQIIETQYDSYWNGYNNAAKSMTVEQMMARLTYDVGKKVVYPKKKVYVFAAKSSHNNKWHIREYKSTPKVKGVLGPYVVKDGEPNPMDITIKSYDTYDGIFELQHTFNLGADVYFAYGHTLDWERAVYFKDKAAIDAFDLKKVLDQFPNKIECVAAEEMPLPENEQNTRFTRKAWKVTYEARF